MKPVGLTLVELLVTLAIVAILLGWGAPAFRDLTAGNRSAAALNQMIGAVTLARASAVTHYQMVTLCPGADRSCAGRDQWHRGALIFIDRNGDGRLDVDDELLRRLPPIDGGRVYWRSFRGRTYLQFRPNGHTPW